MAKLQVEVWSDIACPWCYVGKRRLEAALATLPDPDHVEIVWRSFELDPSAPAVHDPGTPYAERLARKYGTSRAQADAMIDRMTKVGEGEWIDFRFDRVATGSTFDAHRVLHLAATRGLQGAAKERLLRAYFTEGAALGEPEALVRLVGEVGLDPEEVRGALSGDAFAREVRADEAQAARMGVTGVPFFLLAGRYGVAGAQPAELLAAALSEVRERSAAPPYEEGAACGPEGC